MRRIVMFNRISADGYFAGPGGELDWAVPDAELERGIESHLATRGTVLFGRRTYEMFAGFWPHAVAAAAADPHGGGAMSPQMRAMGVWLNEADKYVYSTTLRDPAWARTHLRPTLDVEELAALKAQPGGDIMVFGSGTVVSQLTERALIDEYQFVLTPILLGAGHPLVRDVSRRLPLTLAESKAYPSGNVMLRYERRE